MYDVSIADQLYDASMETLGVAPGADLFNKRVALPLSQLPAMVEGETGEYLPERRLPDLVPMGWIPDLPATDTSTGERGVPFYIPSRVGLYLRLEREGWEVEELRALAEYEEAIIDDILTTDDFEYIEDDRELLIRHAREQVRLFEEHVRLVEASEDLREKIPSLGAPNPRQVHAENARAFADRLETMPWDRLTPEARQSFGRKAYRVRLLNDMIRLHLVEEDRAKIRAGYSPMILFEESRGMLGQEFEFHRIRWDWTLSGPWTEERDGRPLRVPGFVLRGNRIATARTLPPAQYRKMWEESDLDRYLEIHADIASNRICLHCRQPLSEDADPRRRYCDARCRDSARQKKYRERHPGRIIEAQQRYWSS